MSGGHITGGWPFVCAAYLWTVFVLTVYAASLFLRLRKWR